MNHIIIVESPAKARTLKKFLGAKYNIKASMGHIRDLPKKELGIDVEKKFEPHYEISPDKKKIVKEMKDATPGGSGFSFVDLMANQCGIRFTAAATRSSEAARAMQLRVDDPSVIDDLCPGIEGLPEDISAADFQSEFGGLRGAGTRRVVEDIQARLAAAELLQ